MKLWLATFFCFGFVLATAQQNQARLQFESEPLNRALAKIELAFEVQYSYLDSVVKPKTITLADQKYSLEQVNDAIKKQCNLEVVPIDRHFYSIFNGENVPVFALREILVSGFLAKGIDKTADKVKLSPQQIEILPGVTDADVLRSIQQLPGVKSPNETASGLYVRGGTPDQNLILWDGLRIFHPGHLFGMIAPFNPNISQSVNYYNKATDVRFGQSVASIISIETTDKIVDQIHLNAGLNALNADAYVQTPIYKGKLGLQVAARKSVAELWQSPTFNALADKVFEHSGFDDFDSSDHFGFEDYAAKLNYKPNPNTSLALSGLWIGNSLNYSTQPSLDLRTGQKLDIRNFGYSLAWDQQYSQKFRQHLIWHYSNYDFDYVRSRNFSADDYEGYSKQNRIVDSGLALQFDYAFSQKLNLELGYELLGNDSSHSFTALNEGFYVDLEKQHFFNLTHSAFAQARYNLGNWDFRAGLRYNDFVKLSKNVAEPRILIQRKMSEKLIWQSSFENKSQQIAQVRENVASDLSLENYVWVGSDGKNYPLQRSAQWTTGLIWKSNAWLVDGEVYYKTLKGITSQAFGFLSGYDSARQNGNGFTKGFDLLVQHKGNYGRVWATYTYQDSQNRYENIDGYGYFPTGSDLTHALSISALKKWNKFSLTAGWFWHSGKPFSTLNEMGQVTSFNSEKLPDYHRLDISGQYEWQCGKRIKGKMGFSIANLYDNKTVISREYERQYSSINDILGQTYVSRDYHSLGFMPNVFVRLML